MINGDTYGILNRLLLNQRVEPSPEGLLRIFGFVHLYTASGLHLIAMESFLSRFFGRTLLTKKILTVCFWFFLILLWKLQDFRLGFARILVLFFLKELARVQGFRWRVYYPLLCAFCFDFALGIESGWQHYYLAILGGMLGAEYAKDRSPMVQHFYLSLASWLMTAPLDLWEHHLISWMTPIWSLITIPVISTVLFPASVFSYLLLDRIPAWLMFFWNSGIEIMLKALDLGLTFSVVGNRFFWMAFLLSTGAAILYFFILRSKIHRSILCVFFLLSLFMIRFYPFRIPQTELIQLDVGQGDSLLLRRGERIEMIDAGGSFRPKPEEQVFRIGKYGAIHVDTVLFSHLDDDHAGGIRTLLPWIPLGSVEVTPQFERTSRLREWLLDFPSTQWCGGGCLKLANVDWIGNRNGKASGNDIMGIAMIPLSRDSIYLALGDSDSKQESQFWTRHHKWIEEFPRRFLKVSHHGSRYSSSAEFLEKLNPLQAVISVGRRNRYHHPHFSVLQRLRTARIPVHRTDQNGDFVLAVPNR